MRVTIFGAGPAGLVAAHSALHHGADEVVIYARKIEPSTQYGCQYLHAPIPGYRSVARTKVDYQLIGTPEQYRLKVYGDNWQGKVSPEDFVGNHDAWDLRETYRLLWQRLIVNAKVDWREQLIDADWIREHAIDLAGELVISTIPAVFLCMGGHEFINHTIYATGDTYGHEHRDQIICDGTPDHEWYRHASVFGYGTTEWASPRKPQGVLVASVFKPLRTDCDCWPGITRAGRYGKWDKSVLVHHVFRQVTELMEEATDARKMANG